MMLVALVYRMLVCFYEVSPHVKVLQLLTRVTVASTLTPLFPSKMWNGPLQLSDSSPSPFRLCAFGEQEEPLRGSFSLDSESSDVTHRFWFNLTGCSSCQQLMSLCQREQFIFNVSVLNERDPVPLFLSCLHCNQSLVSLHRSTVRALNKNFSIAFFFPAFITLLFFQHNRTVYDMVAGTIVVKRPRIR